MTQTDPIDDTAAERAFRAQLDVVTPAAYVTTSLIAVNVLVFATACALGISILGGRAEEYLRLGANFAPLTTDGAWWRIATCLFVHFGIVHLALNLWALWECGRLGEKLLGNANFAAVYLFAGMCGGMASLLWSQQTITGGASGAIFGVLGALPACMLRAGASVPATALNRLRISMSTFVAYSLFQGFAQTGIDNAAHLGGLAAGFTLGLILARPLEPAQRRCGARRRLALGLLLAAAVLPTCAWLIPDVSRVYRQALALQKATAEFRAGEKVLQERFQHIVDESRRGKLRSADAGRTLRATVVPEWNDLVGRLAHLDIDAQAPVRRDYELLSRYAKARRDMVAAVADYLESADVRDERRIAELRAQADEALRLYAAQQK